MAPEPSAGRAAAARPGPSAALVTVISIATGALVANLYYAQPLIASIAPEIGIRPDLAGSVVGVTQIGYGVGLFLLVSLADLVENRRLVLTTLSLTICGLVGVAVSTAALPFFAASFLIGLCSTGAQVLLPFVAHLVPQERRGRVVGNIMAGVLTGIMLARPASLFIAASFGWRTVFWCSAGLMAAIGILLSRLMPRHAPRGGMHYGQVLLSMAGLFRDMPVLRRRALYQALMFAGFNMFWTAAPLMLAARFGLGEHAVGLFALAGAGGALAAPVAGRLADRGLIRPATAGAMAALGLAFYATGPAVAAMALAPLVVLTLLIDAAVQTNQVVSQRIIFSVPSEIRGRVNAIYMTINFMGGAAGSILGALTYHRGGWTMTADAGAALGLLLLALFAAEGLSARRRRG
ncbi:MFS transporter [Labrys monachus]|uniref:MFS family arabinose efflux permease n=1 Tax=Labrys monachus TaxID=217067 RepID=A0ABU0FLW2_9HYPH|nr:MFS transporter [Labrys monachus]MDQ0395511.1 putative MFS family arabinose efflux permease [Labrys monachus]